MSLFPEPFASSVVLLSHHSPVVTVPSSPAKVRWEREQKVEGAAMISGMPVVTQLSSNGSMRVGRLQGQERSTLFPATIATPLFTPMGFAVIPYQLTHEIMLEKMF